MNWLAFVLALWIVGGVDWGLRASLELQESGVAPSLIVVYVTFVCLYVEARWAWLVGVIGGLVIDLLRDVGTGSDETVVVVGPAAIGGLLAASFVVNVRGLVYRKNVATIAVLSTVSGVLVHLTAAFALFLRSVYDVVEAPAGQLPVALGSALYTGVAGVVLGVVLLAFRRMFGFAADTQTGFRME
ncbi:MAG: hypothetical protein AAGI30_08105 [Planctomycetota bacterium]